MTLTPPVTLTSLFTYLGILIVGVIAMHHVAKWVYQVSMEGFATIGQSLNATLQPYAYSGMYNQPLPRPDYTPPAYATGPMAAAGVAYGAVSHAGTLAGGAAVAGATWATGRMGSLSSDEPRPHVFNHMDRPDVVITELGNQIPPDAGAFGVIIDGEPKPALVADLDEQRLSDDTHSDRTRTMPDVPWVTPPLIKLPEAAPATLNPVIAQAETAEQTSSIETPTSDVQTPIDTSPMATPIPPMTISNDAPDPKNDTISAPAQVEPVLEPTPDFIDLRDEEALIFPEDSGESV